MKWVNKKNTHIRKLVVKAESQVNCSAQFSLKPSVGGID